VSVPQLKWAARVRERATSDAEDTGAAVPSGSMAGAVLTGFGWKIVTIGVSELTRVAVAIVLARLLTPGDYGVAGMAFVFAGLATLFSDLALGGALVQRRDISEEDRSTVFWASLAFSLVVMAVSIALSPFVADFFGHHEVEKLVIALSFSFPLAALTTTQVALLTRRLSYRSLEIREILGILCGAVTALALAVAGFGPWAIVANSLVASAVSTLLLWHLSPWRPRRVFSFQHLSSLSGFGLRLFGIRLLNYANLNADNALIGRFAGAAALGTYSLAYNVMFTPMVRIANPISGVVYPALARMQDDLPRMRTAWLRSKRLSASLLAPAFLLILVTAPDLVHVLFGEKWRGAVPVIELLALAGVAHSLVTLNWTVLQGTGRIKVALRLDFLTTALVVGAFAFGVRWGAVGVAASYAAIKWPLVLIDTYVTTRALAFRFRDALLAGGAILPLAVLAAAGAWAARIGLTDAGAPPALRLVLGVALFVLLYGLLLVLAAPALVAEARDVLGQRAPWVRRPLPGPVERRLTRARTRRLAEREGPYGYRPTPLQEQLLAVALGDPDSAADAWKALPASFSIDERHELEPGTFELLPLAYRNLSKTVYDDPRLPRLKGIYRRSWVKNNLLLGRTSAVAEVLRAAGVPALFLDGPGAAVRYYGDLALRPTNSLHVLVGPEDMDEATARLAGGGWQARPGSDAYPGWRVLFDEAGNACVLRSSLAFDFVRADGGRGESPLWRAAETQQVGETKVLVLTPTDALLGACVAGARYGPLPPTQWLVDAAMILGGQEVDWDRLVGLAVTRGQRRRLREALACLHALPVPMPDRVAEAYAWLSADEASRRERFVFALSSGALGRRGGGLAQSLAELFASSPGESLARTAARLPSHLRARWGVAHGWQLPLAAGRRALTAARRA
jgi:O-antigen/teichoic acid export membrane protein